MGFFDFIGKAIRTITEAVFPRQFIEPEEPEEVKEEYRKKIVKSLGYGRSILAGTGGVSAFFYSFTWENNKIYRHEFLVNKIKSEFSGRAEFHEIDEELKRGIGYDDESETTNTPPFIYPQTEEGFE